jgi:hypothetical protein
MSEGREHIGDILDDRVVVETEFPEAFPGILEEESLEAVTRNCFPHSSKLYWQN